MRKKLTSMMTYMNHVKRIWLLLMILLCLFCFGISDCVAKDINESHVPDLKVILPTGKIIVDIMTLGADAKIQKLMLRFQENIQQKKDWWISYMEMHIKNQKPGTALPYHPNFGISKEDYAELLKNKMSLLKTSEGTLTITEKAKDIIMIDGDTNISQLSKFTINIKRRSVETPFGICNMYKEMHVTSEKSVTSPWDGHKWYLESGTPGKGIATLIEFSIGKFRDQNKGIIYYKARKLYGTESKETADFIGIYDIR